MNYKEEQPVEVGDDTPSTIDQAKAHGWASDIWNFGKAEQAGVEHFNPGLVRRPDGLWLLVRRSEAMQGMPYGMNKIWACKLDGDKKPMGGPFLKFPDSKTDEQFEDPRATFWNNQTWISCVNFTWFPNSSWTGAHIMLGIFQDKGGADITEETWAPLARRDPPVGTNLDKAGPTQGKHNKNVLFWFLNDKLHCLYTSDPWLVVEFGSKWDEQKQHIAEGPKWNYGLIRGGTPPVLVDGLYFTFFHSSLPWRGRYRRYYMGALAFESKPPFKPVLWMQEPLLTGSQNDPWHQHKPLVVFPCGAVHENGKWLVTYGVNDLKSGWVEIPHEDLLKLLKPIPTMPGLDLLADATTVPEFDPVPYIGGKLCEDSPVPFVEPNGGDAKCNVTADAESQMSTGTGAILSSPSIHQSGSAAQTSDPSAAAPKPRGRPRRDGLPPGSVPKPKRKRRRRKRKRLKSSA